MSTFTCCTLVPLITLGFVSSVAASPVVGAWHLETGVTHRQRLFVIGSSLVSFANDLRCFDLATGKVTTQLPLPVDWADFDDEAKVVGDVVVGRIGAATLVGVEPCANRVRWARSAREAATRPTAPVDKHAFHTVGTHLDLSESPDTYPLSWLGNSASLGYLFFDREIGWLDKTRARIAWSHTGDWLRAVTFGDRVFAVERSGMLSAFRIDNGEVVWRSGAANNTDLLVVEATRDRPALLIVADELGGIQSIPLDAPLPHQRQNVSGTLRVSGAIALVDHEGQPLTLQIGDQRVSVRRDGSFAATLDGNGCLPIAAGHTPNEYGWEARIAWWRRDGAIESPMPEPAPCVRLTSSPSVRKALYLSAELISDGE